MKLTARWILVLASIGASACAAGVASDEVSVTGVEPAASSSGGPGSPQMGVDPASGGLVVGVESPRGSSEPSGRGSVEDNTLSSCLAAAETCTQRCDCFDSGADFDVCFETCPGENEDEGEDEMPAGTLVTDPEDPEFQSCVLENATDCEAACRCFNFEWEESACLGACPGD